MKKQGMFASLLAAVSFNKGQGMVDVELAKKPSWRDVPVRPYQEGDAVFTRPTGHHQATWIRNPRETKRQRRQARIDEARTMLECWREARNEKRSGRSWLGPKGTGDFGDDRAVAIALRDYDRVRGVGR